MAFASSGVASETVSLQVRRKSFRAPCALVNGIFMPGRPPINLDYRCALYHDFVHQIVIGPLPLRAMDRRLYWISPKAHRPLFPQKQVGASGGDQPLRLVVPRQ